MTSENTKVTGTGTFGAGQVLSVRGSESSTSSAQYGETKVEKKQEKAGRGPDRDLALEHYRHLTISQLKQHVDAPITQVA